MWTMGDGAVARPHPRPQRAGPVEAVRSPVMQSRSHAVRMAAKVEVDRTVPVVDNNEDGADDERLMI